MYYPDEKMKVNSFRQVAIPRNAEYFARYGYAVSPASLYTGDEPAPKPMNKTDILADMERYDAMKQAEENAKPSKTE